MILKNETFQMSRSVRKLPKISRAAYEISSLLRTPRSVYQITSRSDIIVGQSQVLNFWWSSGGQETVRTLYKH